MASVGSGFKMYPLPHGKVRIVGLAYVADDDGIEEVEIGESEWSASKVRRFGWTLILASFGFLDLTPRDI